MTAEDPDAESTDTADLPEQLRIRREKYDRLSADPATSPFPVSVERTNSLAEIRDAYPDLPADKHTGAEVGVAGRVIFVRNSGKLCFATLREGGVELQIMLSADQIGLDGPGSLADWKRDVDLGDFLVPCLTSAVLLAIAKVLSGASRVAERSRELEVASAAKTRFLAAASHDLRQPVVSIGLLSELLREQPLQAPARFA